MRGMVAFVHWGVESAYDCLMGSFDWHAYDCTELIAFSGIVF